MKKLKSKTKNTLIIRESKIFGNLLLLFGEGTRISLSNFVEEGEGRGNKQNIDGEISNSIPENATLQPTYQGVFPYFQLTKILLHFPPLLSRQEIFSSLYLSQ